MSQLLIIISSVNALMKMGHTLTFIFTKNEILTWISTMHLPYHWKDQYKHLIKTYNRVAFIACKKVKLESVYFWYLIQS